jgi:hypothetical protein
MSAPPAPILGLVVRPRRCRSGSARGAAASSEWYRLGPDSLLQVSHGRRALVSAGQSLAVEDAPAGLASARDAGCRTLAVITTHTASQLSRADFVCAGVSSVEALRTDPGLMSVRISVLFRHDLGAGGDARTSLSTGAALTKGSP